ncbi:stalk domain-containing protein [Paenibacillus oceani]|uniref:Copper amine oxidase-like N-terminal domain-containing protein n=1 Tax=Paenibacillus oceani TaxID=2772510 RepID=A0A927C349_9BACL|nr:stalk domain-containing protein [Paenibacillus oceani]MBD2860445.1 hypothetical protein [Paenibacillus oceani]
MKLKYVTASVLLFVGCASVVQASSMHGDYKGDPVVQVLSGGKKLVVEDAPAVIRDGRTVVPLYLLRQAGVEVKWDAETYHVDLTLPDPSRAFSGDLKKLSEKAKEYEAGNLRLTYNEYGPYLQIDLKKANDSNKDNDRIVALSGLLTETPAETLVVDLIHLDDISGRVTVKRTDAVDFHNKKIEEYQFLSKWGRANVVEMKSTYVPNKPPEPEEPANTMKYPSTVCKEMITDYARQSTRIVDDFNRSGSRNASDLEKYLADYKKNMDAALKEAGCSAE